MKVSIIGLGYVGLPTALLAAKSGLDVCGIDIDLEKVSQLHNNSFSFDESALNKIFQDQKTRNNLTFKSQPSSSDIFVVAVPTPIKFDNTSDLSFVLKAVSDISKVLQPGNLLIIESTCPVDISDHVIKILQEHSSELFNDSNQPLFHLCYCPERVLPGNTVSEITSNPRAIGGHTEECSLKAKEFYSHFVEGKISMTTIKTAACSKLVENAFRDVNIAFANELMKFSIKAGIDYRELITIANQHPRVNILSPGIGVGGHCIPVDPWFLIETDPENTSLMNTARKINDNQPIHIIKIIKDTLSFDKAESVKLLILGISYKANSSDVRDSPAIKIINELNKLLKISEIQVFDPYVPFHNELEELGINFISKMPENLNQFSQIIQLVDHDAFREQPDIIDSITLSF